MKKVSVAVAAGAAVAMGLTYLPVASALAAPAKHSDRPAISHINVTPHPIGDKGGVVTLNAALSRAKRYTITSVPRLPGLPETFKTGYTPYWVIHVPIHVPGNRSHTIVHYRLFLTAMNAHGHAGPASVTMGVKGTPIPAPPITTPPPTSLLRHLLHLPVLLQHLLHLPSSSNISSTYQSSSNDGRATNSALSERHAEYRGPAWRRGDDHRRHLQPDRRQLRS